MNTVWDILHAREPLLNYVCPPICEIIFSGSSSPVIILSEAALNMVLGLALGGVGGFQLSWNSYPGAICYNVYFIGGNNVAVLLAQCIPSLTFLLPEGLGVGEIVVTAITPEGETPPSAPLAYPSGGGGTFLLTIAATPTAGAPFTLGPLDVNGAGSGATTTIREYNPNQTVFLTAELTYNFLAFEKWQKDGVDYDFDIATSLTMVANTTLTAIYSCLDEDGPDVPSDFTLSDPTSLGIFSVPPGTDDVIIAASAPAASYEFIYRGGSIQAIAAGGCGPATEGCPQCCSLPPGCLARYDGGASSFDISNSPTVQDNCFVDQATLQPAFPVGASNSVAHAGGSLAIRWNPTVFQSSVEFPITDFECGDTCPRWEVIQGSGLMALPGAMQIRDFAEVAPLILPIAHLDSGDAGCEDFTSANYPLELTPGAIEWGGNSAESDFHQHTAFSSTWDDGANQFVSATPPFPRMAINGFYAEFTLLSGPRTKASILAEASPWSLTDPFPDQDVDRYWFFELWSHNGSTYTPIWLGVKGTGLSPVGSYQRILCACTIGAPTCLYLESGD